MGILVMDNFDVADLATVTEHGFVTQNGGLNGSWALTTFTEEGMRRNSLTCRNDLYQGGSTATSGAVLQIPIPVPASKLNADRAYYVSMRMRLVSGPSAGSMTPVMTLPNTQTYLAFGSYSQYGLGNQYNLTSVLRGDYFPGGDATKLMAFIGYQVASGSARTQFKPDANGWFHVEIGKAAGSFAPTIWINDYMYVSTVATSNPIGSTPVNDASNFIYIHIGRTGSFAQGTIGFEITDVVVIDPATPGPQYRFGSSGRVLSLDYTSDVINDWAANPAATLSHREMMMIDKSVPDATNILTGLTVGQREQYGVKPIPAKFGPYVPALQVRPRVMNGGASAHSISLEADWGAGLTEVLAKTVAPGGAYDTTPLIMTTKPNGDAWTAADFANAKVGFSVKS